ncbi:MAG TPA: hypothetical protein VNO30_27480 [Kofleriaceae bacterium]|nr:hypothetical protein [Kofleriaceae bacterium]
MDDEIPPALLSRHPELVSVGQALEQLRLGQPVTATCIKCGQQLLVEALETVGVLVIHCPADHTFFRAKRGVRVE